MGGEQLESERAWLLMAVDAEDRQFAGNDGYIDHADVSYAWDSRVPHSRDIRAGDRVVLWDKYRLLGASIVEDIEVGQAPKTVYRCRECEQASIKKRKVMLPFFRCHNQTCKAEFDNPLTETVTVTTYRSVHDAAWVPLQDALSGPQLRALCIDPKSQHAIRPLDWRKFADAIAASGHARDLALVISRAEENSGGHKQALTRVRIGQASFRKRLLEEYGAVCALTGPCPETVLEAGHLYSYAMVGRHHRHGGLLFRRDLHTLFDRGKLAVDPDRLTLSVDEELLTFPMYAALEGRSIAAAVTTEHRRWFREHWIQYRQSRMSSNANY